MNLSEKSDYEINVMVAEIKYPDCDTDPCVTCDDSVKVSSRDEKGSYFDIHVGAFDWCNDDALAFRLMVEMMKRFYMTIIINSTGVTTNNLGEKFSARYLEIDNENIRRAIAELMITLVSQEASK